MNKRPFLTPLAVILSLILMASQFNVFGQEKEETKSFEMTNSKPIDADRYEGIKGDPYLFKESVNATLITNDKIVYEDVYLNYNGYSKEFEVKQGEEFIELDRKFYLRIEIPADKNNEGIVPEGQDNLVFVKNAHSRFGDRMVMLIHHGKKGLVIKEFHSSISEKEKQDVGKTIVTKRFFKKNNYYIVEGEDLRSLKLSKKGIISALGHKSELESFIKKNKYKVDNDAHLREILAYYEKL